MVYAGSTTVRVFLWIFIKTLYIFYIPSFIARLFKKSKVCPSIKDPILLLSAAELADRIRKQKLTSVDVIKSYISRINEVNPIINAVIENRFTEAINDAVKVDELIRKGNFSMEELKLNYPLLGVPFTVKGSIGVLDMKHTSGMLSRKNLKAEVDAVSVQRAKNAGAIPLLTSSVPELCLNWETTNKIIGTTKNPHNTTRTVGGSSGGEACLLGSACSLIGIGSDIAGSLRLPAHFCGVWGHKPTPGAVSYVGHFPSCKLEEEWRSVFTIGPMSRYASDLKLFLQCISEPDMRHQLKLDEPVDVKDIRVHYLEEIDSCLTSSVNADCVGAVHKVIEHLNKVCHTKCEKAEVRLMRYASDLASIELLDLDEVDNYFPGRGEGVHKELFKYIIGRSNASFTSVGYGLLRKLHGLLPNSAVGDCKIALSQLKVEFLNLLGNDGVLILPTLPTEAVFHGDMIRKLFDSGYMSIFNSLGFPVTNCPVTMTRKRLPVGVQVVAAPNCDRLTLAVAIELEKAFGGWKPPGESIENKP